MNVADVAVSLVKVVVVGLALGAGLPAIFALGLRALSVGTVVPGADGDPAGVHVVRTPLMTFVAAACFAIVGLAVVAGIAWIVSGGH